MTDWEKSFILGCIHSQNRHPQLTHRQWETVCKIEKRYRDVEISGVKRLPSGKISYRGTTFDGFNKPRRSNRSEKKEWSGKEGDKVRLIHFGDSSMGHNYSPEARRSFKARHARNIAKGKMSAGLG